MKVWMHRAGPALAPSDTDAQRFVNRLGAGECVLLDVVRPRSVSWHRMYFAICRAIGENQDPPRDEASIDAEVRIRAGHFDVLLFDGLEVRVPKRIAFAEMDADAWEKYWERAQAAIAETFGEEYVRELAYG